MADELIPTGDEGGGAASGGAGGGGATPAHGEDAAAPGNAHQTSSGKLPPHTRLWVLHGVNLDMLGRRDAAHYGALTLAELERAVTREAEALGFIVSCFQTNHEGELIDTLHAIARDGTEALLINPGAWTHYSYALRDALELIDAPVAEVHLSDVESREEWRRQSVIADVAAVRVSGKGLEGYLEAVRRLARLAAGR